MSTTTYIIPDPETIKSRYRLSDEEQKKNQASRENARIAFIEFLKAAAGFYQKGWAFEWARHTTGGHNLTVNGYSVRFKFAEKWIMVENGGSNGRYNQGFHKQSTQIYYGKELTMKDHGKKVVDVIQSMIARDEKQKATALNQNNNAHLAAHTMKYLAKKHGFLLRKDDRDSADGYWPSSDQSCIHMTFRFNKAECKFSFITEEAQFGKIKMYVKYDRHDDSPINFNGSYALGNLSTKFEQAAAVVNKLEDEYHTVAKLWPEAVAYIKEHGEYKD